jgi:hypothetical protein
MLVKPTLNHVLSKRNHHLRDDNIQFFEEGHKYVILSEPDVKYTSVTTWNHNHFPKFDADNIIATMMKSKGWKKGHRYWGLSAVQIKDLWNSNKEAVAGAGTDLHYEIECFMNDNRFIHVYHHKDLYQIYDSDNYDSDNYDSDNKDKSIEWSYFINFVRDFPDLKPYRTEWLIYHEDVKISGSIDMVYENHDGTLSIYDWKRCKNITRVNNFWHYALQLNTYKVILQEKYNKIVKDLFLVRLHPDAEEKNYELIIVPDLTAEVNDLFAERKKEINIESA